jgi:hypothetical protein
MMAPQFLRNTFTIGGIGGHSARGGAARRPTRLSPIGEELDVSRELIFFKFQPLGVWKGSRGTVTPVMSAQPSFRSRRLAGARRRVARCATAAGRTR